jgi:hypothetical protein
MATESVAHGYEYLAIRPVARNVSTIRRFYDFRTVGRSRSSNQYSESISGRSSSATSSTGRSATRPIKRSTSHASIPPSPGQKWYCFLTVSVWRRTSAQLDWAQE